MRVLYFAWLRERIGTPTEEHDLPADVTTAAQLVDWLRALGPRHEAAFADTAAIRVAIDQRHAQMQASLLGAREVAFFPPVTGAEMSVRVQLWDFDQGAEIDALSKGKGDVGAVVSFTGLVRDHFDGAPIDGMELEHYPGMTEAALTEIEDTARARWAALAGVTIIHRYGPLRAGDRIVLVVCASPHRQVAFDAAMFIMDFLKTRAPFWKKELTDDGGHWVDARDSDDEATNRWR